MKHFVLTGMALCLLAQSCLGAVFSYSRPVIVKHSQVSNSDQANFPVYLVLSDPTLKTVANGGHVQSPTGADITFFNDAKFTNLLPYEIVSYNGSNGNLTAVVLCPLLSHTSDTTFYLAYGTSTITGSGANPAAVWNNYQGVYHFEDNSSGTNILNSAVSANGNGTSVHPTNVLSTSAKVGSGIQFDGKIDYLDLGSYATLNGAIALTYSGWIKFNSLVQYSAILERQDNPPGSGTGLSLSGSYQSTASDWLSFVRDSNTSASYTRNFNIVPGTWYYFASVYQRGTLALYINGQPVSLFTNGYVRNGAPTSQHDLFVGKEDGFSPTLNAVMDEVRVSTTSFNADWESTEYNNLNNIASFASLGAEMSLSANGPPKNLSVQVVGVTPTQAILHYSAPDNLACSVQVSESPATSMYTGTFLSLVHDVDPNLFAGADQDSRLGSFSNGSARTFVVGVRGTGHASDGNNYSRALQANTPHYFQVSCSNGTYIGSGTFNTTNVPLGNSAPDPIAYDPNAFGGWAWPTINYADTTVNYIDPQTGLLLKRWTSPGDDGGTDNAITFRSAVDLSGTWQNPSGVLVNADSQYATYTGAGGPNNALFLWGKLSYYRYSYSPVSFSNVDDVRIHINGFGDQPATADRTVSVCISADYGQNCVGSAIDLVLPQSTAADITGPNSWPAPLFGGWGNAPISVDMLMNNFSGTLASVTGNQAVWGANSAYGFNIYFPVTALKPGLKMLIAGTDPTCPANLCTLTAITDEKTVTLQQSLPNWTPLFTTISAPISTGATSFSVHSTNGFVQSLWGPWYVSVESDSVTCNNFTNNTFSNCSAFPNAHANGAQAGENQYLFPDFGFKVWKKTGTGTISLDSSSTDWADSANFYTGYQGADSPYCSTSTVTATYAADGVTPIQPLPGYLCTLQTNWSAYKLYFVAASTGESRKLSNLNNLSPTIDAGSPTHLYVYDLASKTVQSCNYNAADPLNGRFKRWSDGYTNGNNPALTCAIAMGQGQTVPGEIQAAFPQIDQKYFGPPSLVSAQYPYFEFNLRPAQNTIAWYCILDLSKSAGPQQVIKCRNTWDTYPIRWMGAHGDEFLSSGGYTEINAQGALTSPGTAAVERWDLNVTRVYNNGTSTALSSSFVDPQTCEQLGVSSPLWIAQGATGPNCIKINVDSEPLAKTPASGDLTPLGALPVGSRPGPWVHNANSCGGDGSTNKCWSFLQPMLEGDYISDASQQGTDEKFLIAKKTVLGDGTVDLVLARNMNPFQCRSGSTAMAHASGWTPILWPPQSCGGGTYFSKITDPPSATLVDNPQAYLGHTVAWVNGQGNEVHFTPYSWNLTTNVGGYGAAYGVRSGPFPGVIGQGFTFGINDVYPFAGSNHGINIGQIQSHPGGLTMAAPPNESNWGVDGRPLGGGGGGIQALWNQPLTKLAGTQNVYQTTPPLFTPTGPVITVSGWDANLDRKRRQVLAYAGYHLLQDISGPGSRISDALLWSYCVADFAGECVAGSQQGSQYISVPMASTVGVCGNDGTIYAPCLGTAGPHAGSYTQFAVDKPDPYGLRWRKLTNMFGGPGRTDNYANIHALATADWGVSAVKWGDGRRTDIFGIKLPPWPADDSISRNNFVNVTVSAGGQLGSSLRIRFGYNQNLYCSTRLEQCSTAVANSDPYAWVSEPQAWTACATAAGCKINIPAVSSRVLYYVVDRKNAAGVITSGAIMTTAVH